MKKQVIVDWRQTDRQTVTVMDLSVIQLARMPGEWAGSHGKRAN